MFFPTKSCGYIILSKSYSFLFGFTVTSILEDLMSLPFTDAMHLKVFYITIGKDFVSHLVIVVTSNILENNCGNGKCLGKMYSRNLRRMVIKQIQIGINIYF